MDMMNKNQKGFTLVELAIVLVIVGLLISGILKGRELLQSAQLNSTVAAAKSYTSAMITFNDLQRGLPGDLTSPTTRIPNCWNECLRSGDGNGRIGNWVEVIMPRTLAGAPENVAAWAQMNAMNLTTGTKSDVSAIEFGDSDPSVPVGGGFLITYLGTSPFPLPYISATAPRDGHYLALVSDPASGIQVTSTTMTPTIAQRLDKKLDDGKPNTGGVVAIGIALAGSQQCATSTAATGEYATTVGVQTCGAFIRMRD